MYYPCSETKALISFAVTGKLICVFVFAYAKSRFSHDEAHLLGNFVIPHVCEQQDLWQDCTDMKGICHLLAVLSTIVASYYAPTELLANAGIVEGR